MGFLYISRFGSFSNVDHWSSYYYKYVLRMTLTLRYVCNLCSGIPCALLIDNKSLSGVVTDPSSPSSFGAWINHAGNHHVGAISFLIVDFFLFFGVAVLTIVQASQVFAMLMDWTLLGPVHLACLSCALLGFLFPFWSLLVEILL